MSASFLLASSQYLLNSAPPVTVAPFSVGFWCRPTVVTGAAKVVWGLFSSTSGVNYFDLFLGPAAWTMEAGDGTDQQVTAGNAVANNWHYIVLRYISATNRRICVLTTLGIVTHGQSTTSCLPTTIDREILGAGDVSGTPATFMSGQIAEFWKTNTDIQADGLALQDATVRQIAYGGPFSIPHLRKDLVEYHSFRKTLSSDQFDGDNDIPPILGETLTNNGGVTLAEHPPLPYWHVRPGQNKRVLII